MASTITIAKFTLYPSDEPTSYAIGFAYSANGRSGYIDTCVGLDLTVGKTQEEIVNIALNAVSESINSQLKSFEAKSPLLGTQIILNMVTSSLNITPTI